MNNNDISQSEAQQPQIAQQQIARAQGALLALLAGDALGVQVEFLAAQDRKQLGAATLLTLSPGPWHTLPGQPTEDGELVLLLCRMLAFYCCYQEQQAFAAYQYWLQTEPFAISASLQQAFCKAPSEQDLGVAALARQLPIAMMGVHFSLPQIAAWAMDDTALTQPAILCQQISALYAMLLAKAIDTGTDADTLYQDLQQWARELKVEFMLRQSIEQALFMPPANYENPAVPALCAFHNAIWQLLYAKTVGEAIVDTVRQGGDTGSNALIAAALVGAVQGIEKIDPDWLQTIAQCKPQEGVTGVDQPRPEAMWPVDALSLARQLILLTPAELS